LIGDRASTSTNSTPATSWPAYCCAHDVSEARVSRSSTAASDQGQELRHVPTRSGRGSSRKRGPDPQNPAVAEVTAKRRQDGVTEHTWCSAVAQAGQLPDSSIVAPPGGDVIFTARQRRGFGLTPGSYLLRPGQTIRLSGAKACDTTTHGGGLTNVGGMSVRELAGGLCGPPPFAHRVVSCLATGKVRTRRSN